MTLTLNFDLEVQQLVSSEICLGPTNVQSFKENGRFVMELRAFEIITFEK